MAAPRDSISALSTSERRATVAWAPATRGQWTTKPTVHHPEVCLLWPSRRWEAAVSSPPCRHHYETAITAGEGDATETQTKKEHQNKFAFFRFFYIAVYFQLGRSMEMVYTKGRETGLGPSLDRNACTSNVFHEDGWQTQAQLGNWQLSLLLFGFLLDQLHW
jgi:hypothetical protein